LFFSLTINDDQRIDNTSGCAHTTAHTANGDGSAHN